LSIRRQCELLELERSTYYYEPVPETPENLALMRAIDEMYLKHPYYGSRRLAVELRVNRKRMQRLMRVMGLEAVYPKPRTTRRCRAHRIYPYLLRNLHVERPDQVWSSDITYIPLTSGYLYLAAVMDWYSRYVLAWRLSETLEGRFCCEALDEALSISQPEIFNTDQGSQFTSGEFTGRLERRAIQISMDGRGRALDNAFIERLWRTVKYEEVYLQEYKTGCEAGASLKRYLRFYNQARKHQALRYQTPAEVYFGAGERVTKPRSGVTAKAR
jgi:putative transposase